MKRTGMLVVAASFLVWGLVACSDDDNPTDKCEKEDSQACATTFSSCQAECGVDATCLNNCQVAYCDCLDEASCDPPAECKDDALEDGGNTQEDAGVVDDDSGSGEEDSGNGEEDSGSGEEDSGNGECDATAAETCNTEHASCLADCMGDLTCQEGCLDDFCSCLFMAGCDDAQCEE